MSKVLEGLFEPGDLVVFRPFQEHADIAWGRIIIDTEANEKRKRTDSLRYLVDTLDDIIGYRPSEDMLKEHPEINPKHKVTLISEDSIMDMLNDEQTREFIAMELRLELGEPFPIVNDIPESEYDDFDPDTL